MLRKLLRFSGFKLGLIITLVFCLIKVFTAGGTGESAIKFLDRVENAWMDWKFRLRGGPETEEERKEFQDKAHVVIVAIDEKSTRMKDLGLWPWPRMKIARLVEKLNACGAKVIGFDVVFAEPDSARVAPTVVLLKDKYKEAAQKDEAYEQFLADTLERVDGDTAFAKVLAEAENVVLGYFFFVNTDEIRYLDPQDIQEGADRIGFGTIGYIKPYPGTDPATAFPQALGVRANLPLFTEETEYYGFFNQKPDDDMIYRRVPLIYSLGKNVFPSLNLQVLSLYYGNPVELLVHLEITADGEVFSPDNVRLFIGPLDWEQDRDVELPVEVDGMLRVNFYGHQKTFRHVSAGEVIHGNKEACAAVRDKVVLVGVTTMAVYDLRPTPFEVSFPGVEIHASVIENAITGNFLVRSTNIILIELLFMLVVGVLLSWFLTRFRLTLGLIVTTVLLAGVAVSDYLVLFLNGYQAQVVLIEAYLIVLFIGIAVFRYATEEREKSRIRHAFQFYLSGSVIDTMLQDMSKLKLGGERRELSVLFSDIRGFTTISEGLAPEKLAELLNEYLTPMTDIVFKYNGTLDKYMGDAIMAIFGAPLAFEDHPRAACRCALEMMEELARLQSSWKERGLPEMDIGIGVNTGPMSVGNMGSATRFDYTVLGDNVNLGSRLEGLNKQYGTHIIISESTLQAIGSHFTTRELDAVRVKGKLEPVRIFELVHWGPLNPEQDGWIQEFDEALENYKARKWDEAQAGFEAQPDDSVSRMYVGRCKDMKANPPGDDWDGVYEMKTK